MAKYAWPAGSTSKTTLLFIQDSASTTGAGRVSVSAGNINAQEIRVQTDNTVTRVTVSVTNLAALTDAYLAGGIFPIDPVNTPGWYRFDIPNTALSAGAVTAGISIIGTLSASNIAQLALEIQLQNTPADMVAKAGVSVTVSTLFPVVVRMWDATSVSSSNLAVTDFSTRVNANVGQWAGTSVTSGNIALWQSVSTANVTAWNGASVSTNNIVLRSEISLSVVNVTAWGGVSVSTNNIALWSSVSTANVTQWDGASTSAQDVALFDSSALFNALVGLSVNATRWAGASTSSNSIVFRSEISLSVVNVTQWAGMSVSTNHVAVFEGTDIWNSLIGLPVDVYSWAGVSTSTNSIVFRSEISLSSVNVTAWGGASVSASEIAHIKAKTDQLVFTVPNQVDSNIQYVNDVLVNGTGAPGSEWGP